MRPQLVRMRLRIHVVVLAGDDDAHRLQMRLALVEMAVAERGDGITGLGRVTGEAGARGLVRVAEIDLPLLAVLGGHHQHRMRRRHRDRPDRALELHLLALGPGPPVMGSDRQDRCRGKEGGARQQAAARGGGEGRGTGHRRSPCGVDGAEPLGSAPSFPIRRSRAAHLRVNAKRSARSAHRACWRRRPGVSPRRADRPVGSGHNP